MVVERSGCSEGPGSNTSLRECPDGEMAEPSKKIFSFVVQLDSPPRASEGRMLQRQLVQVWSWYFLSMAHGNVFGDALMKGLPLVSFLQQPLIGKVFFQC